MTLKLACNTTDGPLLADESGYQIGGRSWGVVDTNSQVADDAFAAGWFVDADEDVLAASGRDDALAAVAALHARRDRVEAAAAMDKDDLIAAADPAVIETLEVGGDGKPAKADLVAAVDAGTIDPDAAPAEDPATDTSTVTAKKTTSRTAAKK